MRRLRLALLALAAASLLAAAQGAGAQALPDLRAGASVRLRAPSVTPYRLRGTLRAVAGDTLVMRLHTTVGTVRIPLAAVTAAEVEAGRRGAVVTAVLAGAAGALAAGSVVYLMTYGSTCDVGCGPMRPPGGFVVTFAAVGAGLGAGLGWALGPRQWRRIPLR